MKVSNSSIVIAACLGFAIAAPTLESASTAFESDRAIAARQSFTIRSYTSLGCPSTGTGNTFIDGLCFALPGASTKLTQTVTSCRGESYVDGPVSILTFNFASHCL